MKTSGPVVSRKSRRGRRSALLLALLGILPAGSVRAGAAYPVPGAEFRQDFDGLPVVFASNSNIQSSWPTGWKDDSEIVQDVQVGLPGWYLHHPVASTTEGGSNTHQRLRFGAGANTGSFWAFGSNASAPEKALGSIGSSTVAANGDNMRIALCLVNQTGAVLTEFTLTYDGEQWRDGQSPEPEILHFGYSLTATAADWSTPEAVFAPVPALDFTGPAFTGTSTGGSQVDGNTTGLLAGITATVTGLAWNPGAELWLRCEDPQLASNADDGLAIDNVVFTATASGTPPAGPADPALALMPVTGGSGWELQWTGTANVTTRIQHSPDLSTWQTEPASLTEITGPMAWPIPAALIPPGRHFFRLQRTAP